MEFSDEVVSPFAIITCSTVCVILVQGQDITTECFLSTVRFCITHDVKHLIY